jgi:hypothetical protein
MTVEVAFPAKVSPEPLYTRIATLHDLDSVVALINDAFLDENKYARGERTNTDEVRSHIQKGHFFCLRKKKRSLE